MRRCTSPCCYSTAQVMRANVPASAPTTRTNCLNATTGTRRIFRTTEEVNFSVVAFFLLQVCCGEWTSFLASRTLTVTAYRSSSPPVFQKPYTRHFRGHVLVGFCVFVPYVLLFAKRVRILLFAPLRMCVENVAFIMHFISPFLDVCCICE